MKNTNIKRTAFCITQKCNLKCELCLAFIPYYSNPQNVSVKEVEEVLKIYFKVVDTVQNFTITGGEPLLNPDLYKILRIVFSYSAQILKSIDFVTNGTLLMKDNILEILEKNKDKVKIVLSDYGKDLSRRIEKNIENIEKKNLQYRVSKFHGEDLYFDGWIDFRDHSKKYDSIAQRDEHASKCIHRAGKYFVINDGQLHCCSRGYWRSKKRIIPLIKGEYVDLIDKTQSIKEKRKDLIKMFSLKSSSSCTHCIGLKNGIGRHYPAVQLKEKDQKL